MFFPIMLPFHWVVNMTEDNMRIIIGLRIMQRRKACGIKQAELAEAIGVSDNQISNIENGKSFPRLGSLIKICCMLDCSIDYLCTGIMKPNLSENIVQLIESLPLEEQKTLWTLLDCYIHRNDNPWK